MNPSPEPQTLANWQQCVQECSDRGDYHQAALFYEQAIAAEPEVKSHYWNLGLMLLLQGQETEAQTTWLMAMLDGESEQIEIWNQKLVEVLQQEARQQEELSVYFTAWTIRQQIRELVPTEIHNLLHLILLAVELKTYTGEELTDFGTLQLLQSDLPVAVDFELLLSVLEQVLEYAPLEQSSLDLVEASLTYPGDETQILRLLNILLKAAVDISYFKKQPRIAATLCEFGLCVAPQQPEFLYHLSRFYQDSEQYEKGIETAELYLEVARGSIDEIFANKGLVRALMTTGGHWQEACAAFDRHKAMLRSQLEPTPTDLASIHISRLFNAYFFAPYFRDNPREDRPIQNQISRICQINTQIQKEEQIKRYAEGHWQRRSQNSRDRRLKIGYLSHCFKSHSVGWLARWLFHHADRDNFELYIYAIVSANTHEPLQQWYAEQATKAYRSPESPELAEQIYQDEIDILVELDSLTLDTPCEVVALKPAPIQVTWLGWDASGIPMIDYFIADPYVLPESAQEYYNETIWRLPNTYIAVDGFEVGVPTLRREDLGIESDAVVYLCAQRGYKRHLDTVRLQMQIIKQVPNSHFAIKGSSNLKAVHESFLKIAEEEGVEANRLHFLPMAPSEVIHRANLTIADVVLDTYPYNGATTTLETLWMGIPMVTRVGEQFAARNSYTMMMNAGITEGIAWTDEEYVEWGVRLGKDEALRQNISWKLRQSRQTSPLWNGKQFAREMEKAYREMWIRYINEL